MPSSVSTSFSNKSAIFFDLDGTLVDSVPDLALAINNMLSEIGRPAFNEEDVRQWVGNGPEIMIARALTGSINVAPDLDQALLKSAIEKFNLFYNRDICVNTRPYPGVVETIKHLKAQQWPLAVITNKSEQFVQPVLEGVGLANIFDLVIGGDTLPQKKPAPEPLLYAAKQFNKTLEECVMVGDSKNDIVAAKAANIDSIGVTYGYNYGENIAIHNPNVAVDNFADLLQLFNL